MSGLRKVGAFLAGVGYVLAPLLCIPWLGVAFVLGFLFHAGDVTDDGPTCTSGSPVWAFAQLAIAGVGVTALLRLSGAASGDPTFTRRRIARLLATAVLAALAWYVLFFVIGPEGEVRRGPCP